jgi:hypothetical protein
VLERVGQAEKSTPGIGMRLGLQSEVPFLAVRVMRNRRDIDHADFHADFAANS